MEATPALLMSVSDQRATHTSLIISYFCGALESTVLAGGLEVTMLTFAVRRQEIWLCRGAGVLNKPNSSRFARCFSPVGHVEFAVDAAGVRLHGEG